MEIQNYSSFAFNGLTYIVNASNEKIMIYSSKVLDEI